MSIAISNQLARGISLSGDKRNVGQMGANVRHRVRRSESNSRSLGAAIEIVRVVLSPESATSSRRVAVDIFMLANLE
jgi:hypothetical protein